MVLKPVGLYKATMITIDSYTMTPAVGTKVHAGPSYQIDLMNRKADLAIGLAKPHLDKNGLLRELKFAHPDPGPATVVEVKMTIDLDGDGGTVYTRSASAKWVKMWSR